MKSTLGNIHPWIHVFLPFWDLAPSVSSLCWLFGLCSSAQRHAQVSWENHLPPVFFFLFVCFFSSRLFISEDTLALPTSSFSSLAHTPPISLPPLHGHELAKFTVDPMDIQLYIFTICTKCFISQCISFMESSKSWPLYRKKKSRASRVKDICLKIYR